ncbi:MAG: hypothetical protein H6632_07275 [Anaerolineales bacterium]|nr:hypothetical protein [Anaerolineales bacterium]
MAILTAAGSNVDEFAYNDGLAGSVIAALKSQGLDPIPVSGQDATVVVSRTSCRVGRAH